MANENQLIQKTIDDGFATRELKRLGDGLEQLLDEIQSKRNIKNLPNQKFTISHSTSYEDNSNLS